MKPRLNIPFLLLSLLMVTVAQAQPKKAKSEAVNSPKVPMRVQMRVVFGKKLTEFVLFEDQGKNHFIVQVNGETTLDQKSNVDDLRFLVAQFKKIPPKREAGNHCLLQKVEVKIEGMPNVKSYEASACLSENTEASQALLDLVNQVSYWLAPS